MQDAISSGIFHGRPFGGVSISWSHDLNHLVFPLTNYEHKRVVSVELLTEDQNFLFICMYMPFFDTRNRDSCMTETVDAISMIDLLINDHPQHHVIIGGDLNTEMKGESPFDQIWTEFLSKNSLAY